MQKFKKILTDIENLIVIAPTVFEDERGFFMETYNKEVFFDLGISKEFVQVNQSHSKKAVLRGLHFQQRNPQAKLVRVLKGSVLDVAVDLRNDSPTYKDYFGVEISEVNKLMLYIPEKFAHGFLTLQNETLLEYMVSEYYDPDSDTGIKWHDPELSIRWPLAEYKIKKPILSEKDRNLPFMKEFDDIFFTIGD